MVPVLCIVPGDGELYMCGANDSGQLGVKAGLHQEGGVAVPARVTSLDLHKVTALAVGQGHSLALLEQVRM